MTKKDFELIAGAMRKERTPFNIKHHKYALDNMALTLADALATTNPQFDRARFLQACGVSP